MHTKRLTLSPVSKAHCESLVDLIDAHVAMGFEVGMRGLSRNDYANWLLGSVDCADRSCYVVALTDAPGAPWPIGMITLRTTGRALSYWFGRAHWGMGYATESVSAFVRATLVRDGRGDRGITALVRRDNHASISVLDKVGFRFAGIERYATALTETHLRYVHAARPTML